MSTSSSTTPTSPSTVGRDLICSNQTIETNTRPTASYPEVWIPKQNSFYQITPLWNRFVYNCRSAIFPDSRPEETETLLPPKVNVSAEKYIDLESLLITKINEELDRRFTQILQWEKKLESIKTEYERRIKLHESKEEKLQDELRSVKQLLKQREAELAKSKSGEVGPEIEAELQGPFQQNDQVEGQKSEADITNRICAIDPTSDEIRLPSTTCTSIDGLNLMDQPRIDKFDTLYAAIQDFVKEHTREPTQDSAVGFNAEKISEGCNAWGNDIKDLWLQSVIANIIHEELFEQDEVKDSKDLDAPAKDLLPESTISSLSASLSEKLCDVLQDQPNVAQALHDLSQQAHACAHSIQTSKIRYIWAQKIGKLMVRSNEVRVQSVLAGGRIEDEKLYEMAFMVFGALIKHYGEGGAEQVEVNKPRVVARSLMKE